MATIAKLKTQSGCPVTWRDGIHISGSSLWCDARRPRDVCFVSAANHLRGAKHGQLIATPETMQFLQVCGQLTSNDQGGQLAVPLAQPFTLGTQRMELFSSGHGYGSASLLFHLEGRKIVYAGAINPNGSRLGHAIDHRSAQVLIISACYGQPHFSFPEPNTVIRELVSRCQEICDNRGIAVLLVRTNSKAMETAAIFRDSPMAIHAHNRFYSAAAAINSTSSVALPTIKRWHPRRLGPQVLLWPLATRRSIKVPDLPKASSVILVSGSVASPEACTNAGANQGFAWSDQADYSSLIRYIDSSKAEQVYLTDSHDQGRALIDALPRVRIKSIGPPQQLQLFGSDR